MKLKWVIIIVAVVLFVWWYKTRPYEIDSLGNKIHTDGLPF